MSAEMEDASIPCTVWLKKPDGRWLGCLVMDGGEMTRAGAELLKSFKTVEDVRMLAEKKAVWSLAGDRSPEPAEFYPECGSSLMKMQAKEHGEYCYVFDEATGKWWFGVSMSQPLEELMKFIQRR